MFNLKDKVAIITGARRGMGKSHALTLAKAGAKVVVSDISLEDCQKVADLIKKNKGEAIAVKCDVTKKEEADNMVKAAIDKWGKVDVLVNNAGIVEFKPFIELTEKEWDRMLAINLKGYFLCAQAAVREMIKQKSGVIVNIASVEMGQVGAGMPNIVHYCASKGGIVGMTEALAVELAPHNIRVNAIAPGFFITPPNRYLLLDKEGNLTTRGKSVISHTPMAEFGRPDDLMGVCIWLSSKAARFITGIVVPVDGGFLAYSGV